MNSRKVTVKLQNNSHDYQINVGHNLLNASGEWARNCLAPETKKIVVVSNAKVFRLYGERVKSSFESQDFDVYPFLMKDGERYKSLQTLEILLKFIGETRLARTDAVVALGGGVVGDLAGFASAIFMRGLAFLQIPTTLLAMIDSSVGGKTGVNSAFEKI